MTTDGAAPPPSPRAPLDPAAPQPKVDEHGLVVVRPPDDGQVFYDDPMFQTYQWVAMLDPAELAVGVDWIAGPTRPPVELEAFEEVDHHHRPAWEGVARATPSYHPRCSCCALLFSPQILESGPVDQRWLASDFAFPDSQRVRIDVATGVCVFIEELGGSRPGAGHDLTIEAVDEPMGDQLFGQPGDAITSMVRSRLHLWRPRQ